MRNSWFFQLNLSVEISFLLSTGVSPSGELIKGKIKDFWKIPLFSCLYNLAERMGQNVQLF